MSAQAHPRTRSGGTAKRRPSKAQRQRRRKVLRRRLFLVAFGVVAATVLLAVIVRPFADKAVQEIALPLRHEDIIRQQAQDKGLDPSLIAGVIYVESRFRDQTSHAGAKGLMQILPSTADYIASKSGGTAFEQGDLATPRINIAYGAWYLRYLLDKYDGDEVLALAAYNAGEGQVDGWLADARARGEGFDPGRHVPCGEPRPSARPVLGARDDYRRQYARELGL